MKCILGITFLLFWGSPTYAWSWHDLWETSDRQAQKHMNANDYVKAEKKFKRLDWRAAAAYRAGHYQEAASLYQLLHDQEGFYNLGNSFAQLGQYEKAIQAYDKAIALNSKHPDALYNRDVIKSLLKKQQQSQNNQNKQHQEKQQNQNQDQNSPSTSNNKQNLQPQDNSQQNLNQDKKGNAENQPQAQEKPADTKASEPEKELQRDQQEQKDQSNQANAESNQPSKAEQEQQQANAQWLRLIPDDPGGLLKEKFKRDYLRRQNR